MKCSHLVFFSFVFAALSASTALAQAGAAPTETSPATGKFDLGASFFEAFNGGSNTGNGTTETLTRGTGGMLEGRYMVKPLIGFGASFSYNHESINLAPNTATCAAFYDCGNRPASVSAKASELVFDWLPSVQYGRMRAFALAGLGFAITIAPYNFLQTSSPNTIFETANSVRPVYVFGGGLDYNISTHFGARFQYRDNIYKAPAPFPVYPATKNFISSSQPMGGFFYRF